MKELRIWLEVEVEIGTDLDRAAEELIELATRLGCGVKADFNGVRVYATSQCTPESLLGTYWRAQDLRQYTPPRSPETGGPMNDFSPGDRVRMLGRYGNQIGTGVVASVAAQDTRGKRALYLVALDDGRRHTLPAARLRKDDRKGETT